MIQIVESRGTVRGRKLMYQKTNDINIRPSTRAYTNHKESDFNTPKCLYNQKLKPG